MHKSLNATEPKKKTGVKSILEDSKSQTNLSHSESRKKLPHSKSRKRLPHSKSRKKRPRSKSQKNRPHSKSRKNQPHSKTRTSQPPRNKRVKGSRKTKAEIEALKKKKAEFIDRVKWFKNRLQKANLRIPPVYRVYPPEHIGLGSFNDNYNH